MTQNNFLSIACVPVFVWVKTASDYICSVIVQLFDLSYSIVTKAVLYFVRT